MEPSCFCGLLKERGATPSCHRTAPTRCSLRGLPIAAGRAVKGAREW